MLVDKFSTVKLGLGYNSHLEMDSVHGVSIISGFEVVVVWMKNFRGYFFYDILE